MRLSRPREHLSTACPRPYWRGARSGVTLLHRDLRASDVDREQAVAFLKAHYTDGRLSADDV